MFCPFYVVVVQAERRFYHSRGKPQPGNEGAAPIPPPTSEASSYTAVQTVKTTEKQNICDYLEASAHTSMNNNFSGICMGLKNAASIVRNCGFVVTSYNCESLAFVNCDREIHSHPPALKGNRRAGIITSASFHGKAAITHPHYSTQSFPQAHILTAILVPLIRNTACPLESWGTPEV